ncbi:MAG: hydroxymethylglutaryl-CoA lyase, partial [Pseudomonadota bacterium]
FRDLEKTAGRSRIALALNEKGMRRAIDAEADEINFVLVASETFGKRNQGMTPEESAAMLDQCAPLAHEVGIPLSATISVAFGDPYDGEVDSVIVEDLARRAVAAGVVELALGDTIGVATPWAVRAMTERLKAAIPETALRMHFHDTRGLGPANVFAAVEAGVDIVDASCGGIGGCPFAPAATGNVATEDIVYMLERAGFETGINLAQMIETARWLETVLGHSISSSLSRAGTFP